MKPSVSYTIAQEEKKCGIYVGHGLLSDASFLRASLKGCNNRLVIITHNTLEQDYGHPLATLLTSIGFETYLLSFPSGEQHKNRETKARLEDEMLNLGLGRDTTLIALGGGIVTDLGGFLAATYCRGIPLITAPSSLLGMVDACVGGKNGVNVPQGKNLIGTIWQPRAIWCDLALLSTLPLREVRNGMVEMIKHGMIADADYFTRLDMLAENLLRLESKPLQLAIEDSCRIKTRIVEEDERESGKRTLLNYGHTIGHSLEVITDYSMPHGEAVAIGLLAESRLSFELGFLPQRDYERIGALLIKYGLPMKIPGRATVDALLQAMSMDKKSRKGKPRFVMLSGIGQPHEEFCMPVDDAVLRTTLEWLRYALCGH